MASIPLPALDIKQQQGPLAQYAQAQQIAAGQQEAQLRDTQIQQAKQQQADTEAQTKAMQEWDGKDYTQLPSLILKNGGSSNAVFAATQHINDVRAKVSAIAKDDAETGSKNLETNIKNNDEYRGRLQSIINAPADQKDALWDKEITAEEQAGKIKPGSVSHAYPGDDQATVFANHFALGSVLAKEATEKQTAQARADAAKTGAEHLQAELPGGALNKVTQEEQIAKNPVIQGAKVNLVEKEAAARAAAEAAIARNGNDALANVPKQLITPATGAAEKANAEYADAKSVSDRMKATMDAAHKGNVISYQIIPEEGTLQITTSQGVHRINKTEIDQYAGGGSLWQRMEGHFGKQLSGKSIPDSVLDDMKEIQDIQAKGATARYNNKLASINQTYGAKFKPVEMEGLSNGKTLTAAKIQQAAKDHNISVDEATRQAKAAGYTIQ